MEYEKKVVYQIKVDKNKKDRFLKIAKMNNTDAAKLIRQFMDDYLKKHSQTTINNYM